MLRIILLIGAVFSFPSISTAETPLDRQKQALDIIAEFADRFCKNIPLVGVGDAVELSVQGKAELSGIVKKLAVLGLEGASHYQNSEYQGLLQKDLIEGLKSNVDCRIRIWGDLKSTLLASAPKDPTVSQETTPHATSQTKKEVRVKELTGTVGLSIESGATQVCLRIYGYENGLPGKYRPVFHAWVEGSAVDIPMKPSLYAPCRNGYVLAEPMPQESRGGSLQIDGGTMEWVSVGNFAVEKGNGCQDVGIVESYTIKWRSGRSEQASQSGIPINGGYGWICRG